MKTKDKKMTGLDRALINTVATGMESGTGFGKCTAHFGTHFHISVQPMFGMLVMRPDVQLTDALQGLGFAFGDLVHELCTPFKDKSIIDQCKREVLRAAFFVALYQEDKPIAELTPDNFSVVLAQLAVLDDNIIENKTHGDLVALVKQLSSECRKAFYDHAAKQT